MYGHKLDFIRIRFRVLAALERKLLQELWKGDVFPKVAFELVSDTFELHKIFIAFLVAEGADVFLIAGFCSRAADDLGYPHFTRVASDSFDKPDEAACVTVFEWLAVKVLRKQVKHARPLSTALWVTAFMQFFKRRELHPSEPPPRFVDHALQRKIVAVGNHTQIRDHVEHFHPLKEFDSSVDLVRDPSFRKPLFHKAGEEARSVEHREIRILPTVFSNCLFDDCSDLFRLLIIALRVIMRDLRSRRKKGVKVLF